MISRLAEIVVQPVLLQAGGLTPNIKYLLVHVSQGLSQTSGFLKFGYDYRSCEASQLHDGQSKVIACLNIRELKRRRGLGVRLHTQSGSHQR